MSVLLGEVDSLSGAPVSQRLRLDLERMRVIPEANPVWRYLQTIIRERGDYNGRVLTVRRDDARALCAVLRVDEPALHDKLTSWGVLVPD